MARTVNNAHATEFGFQLDDDWSNLPQDRTTGLIAVATDSKDRAYLFKRHPIPLVVLDKDRNYVTSWGEGPLEGAHGIFIDEEDNLYLPAMDSSVILKYSPEGNLLMTLGTRGLESDTGYEGNWREPPPRAAGPFNRPSDVAVASSGDIYVSDGYGNARVHAFTPTGELIRSWGQPGKTAPGDFHLPHGIWVHADGRIFVADRQNDRIQIFAPDGCFLNQWSGLRNPCDIFIGRDDLVYVAELDSLVAIFTLTGELLARWSSPTSDEHMRGGHSIWLDTRGDIYVVQYQAQHRLLKYRRG
jgi:DNA-binding beta-propeller fold protein YncE